MSINILAIDTETTGLENAVPIEIYAEMTCYESKHDSYELAKYDLCSENITRPDVFHERYNPGRPIELAASAIHGWFDEDVRHFPMYDGYVVHTGVNHYMGHHVRFDLEVLGLYKDGNSSVPFICTKALAAELFPDLISYALSVVYAHCARLNKIPLDTIRRRIREAHGAENDVAMCLYIFHTMASRCENIMELVKLVNEDPLCGTPKHKGKRMSEVFETDRQYVEWYLSDKNVHRKIDHTEVWINMIAQERALKSMGS